MKNFFIGCIKRNGLIFCFISFFATTIFNRFISGLSFGDIFGIFIFIKDLLLSKKSRPISVAFGNSIDVKTLLLSKKL